MSIESPSSKECFEKREAYFSVSHLLNKVHVAFPDGHMESHYMVVAGKSKDGKTKYQAFGGGAKLSQKGQELLTHTHGEDIRFRSGEESDDARFYIPIPPNVDRNVFIRETLEPFMDLKKGLIEDSIQRELFAEFQKVVPEFVSRDDNSPLQIEYQGVVSPVHAKELGSSRSDGAVAYERIFHLFNVTLSPKQFDALKNSPQVKILDQADIAEIGQAAEQGKTVVELGDGTVIAENIFPTGEARVE